MKRNICISSAEFNIQFDVLQNLKLSERLLVMWDNGSIEFLECQEIFRDNWSMARNQPVVAFMIVDIAIPMHIARARNL